MAYKVQGDGNISFEGNVVNWVQLIQDEHQRSGIPCDVQQYMSIFAMSASNIAKEKWSTEWFGKNKVTKLDSMVSTDPQGNIIMNIFETLDFLADSLDLAFLKGNKEKITSQVHSMLRR
jgi:hypothetical protein